MKSIALFGCLIAACSIAGVVAPAAARSGGGGAAAAAGVHGALRAAGPAFVHGLGPIFARGLAVRRALRGMDLRRQRNAVLPFWPAYGDFDPFYYYPPADTPMAASQQPPNRVLVVAPGCRTQDQQVHSEAGGVQVVHITRCY